MFFPLLAQIADATTAAAAQSSTAAGNPPEAIDAVAATAAAAAAELAKFRSNALNDLWSGNFQQLNTDELIFLGGYYGLRVGLLLVLMTLAWTLSSWASAMVRAALSRVKFDETLTIFLAKLVRWLILLLVALMCLSKFGVETAGFAAVIGAAGLAIGLAFQGTLSNFAAGAMLLIFRPYKVGDEVSVAGHLGTVFEIELFTTAIDTADNRRVIIPNSSIFGSVIENITYHAMRRAAVDVGTAYTADIDQTRATLERALRSVTQVVVDPKPEVVLLSLGVSSVNWQVRGWARKELLGDAKQAITRAVKVELDRARIEIPFPQMDIRVSGAMGEEARQAA